MSSTTLLCSHASLTRWGDEGLSTLALVEFGCLMETHLLVDNVASMLIVETCVDVGVEGGYHCGIV